jgi:hypothetical protein
VIHGEVHYLHQFDHANTITSVYMSTPNLPIRYSIENDGTGDADTMDHGCATVISEGGQQLLGKSTYISTQGGHLTGTTADVLYAGIGIRLQSGYLGLTVDIEAISALAETADDFEWVLLLNPTVAGSPVWGNVAGSGLQRALGASANTVTSGYPLAGGWVKSTNQGGGTVFAHVNTVIKLGSDIAGVPDEIWLAIRPLTDALNIQTSMSVIEQS